MPKIPNRDVIEKASSAPISLSPQWFASQKPRRRLAMMALLAGLGMELVFLLLLTLQGHVQHPGLASGVLTVGLLLLVSGMAELQNLAAAEDLLVEQAIKENLTQVLAPHTREELVALWKDFSMPLLARVVAKEILGQRAAQEPSL